MSRNKSEGQYAGCIRGKHVRCLPKYEKNNVLPEIFGENCWNNECWPSSDGAWIVMYRERGVGYTVYRPRYEGK